MLEELNALLEESKKLPEQSFEEIPVGKYEAIIDGAEFTESKKSGNLMFKWTLTITEGDYAKRKEWKYTVLNKPENMKRLVTELNKFGINTSSMDTIQASIEDLLDVEVEMEITKNGEYRNISIKPLR